MLTPFILHIPYLPSRLKDRLLLTFSLLPSPPLTIPQELAEFNSATEAHLYTREPSTVSYSQHPHYGRRGERSGKRDATLSIAKAMLPLLSSLQRNN